MRKGQIASIDLFIAITIFVMLLGVVLHAWNLYNMRLQDNIEYERMQLAAFRVSDLLAKSTGYPGAWEENPGAAETLGLASSGRVLSASKVSAFASMGYDVSRQKLKLVPYEYRFRIKQLSNNVTTALGLPVSGDLSVTAERYVSYNNEKAIMEFTVWK